MGSCCVREKEQNPATQNLPQHIQVIRMQRRELLINHQQSKSIHQLAQVNGNSNNEQTDFDTNNSTNFSPIAATIKAKTQTQNTQASQPPTSEKQTQEVPEYSEEMELTTELPQSGQRQEQDKQSAIVTPPFINLQTLSSKNIINSDSNFDGEEQEQNMPNEKDITEIVEEDHEDSFSKQLTEQLRASLINNNQFMGSNRHKDSGDSDFPMQANDISSISGFSQQRQTFPSKFSSISKTIQFEKQSPYGSRPSSSNNLNINCSVSKSEAGFKGKSRNASPTNQDLITQKQEVFNFQKSDDLVKLQSEAWAIKEEQLKTELKRQETYKMEEELKKMDRRKMMKQFTQSIIGGTPFYRNSNNNTPMNFQSTQGLGSVSCSTRSPCSSDHKTKPIRTNSTHFTQQSQSLRSSYINGGAMPGSINIPTSIFESFKAKHAHEVTSEGNIQERID